MKKIALPLLVLALVLGLIVSQASGVVIMKNAGTFTLEENQSAVAGVLIDASGAPVKGAELVFTAGDENVTVTTGADGRWEKVALNEGTWKVSATLNGVVLIEEQSVTIGGESMNLRFSAQTGEGALTVNVFADKNKNGDQGKSEGLFAGAKVELLYVSGGEQQTVAMATSKASDVITFSGLPAGTYRLRATLPACYGFSKHLNKVSLETNIMYQDPELTQTSNEIVIGNEMVECGIGVMELAGISGRVWLDSNGDGVMNSGESGLANANVKVYGMKNGLSYEITTDETGSFSFTQLKPGTYYLQVKLPDGMIFTRKAETSGGSLFTGEGESSDKKSYALSEPRQLTDQNIGAVPVSRVEVYCFLDNNYNGLWDEGEKALSGMKVELSLNGSNSALASASSNKSGELSFGNLRSDTYKLRAVLPEGDYDFTVVTSGGNCFKDNGDRSSIVRDLQVGVGSTERFYVGAVKTGTISGSVFYDEDYSGTNNHGKDKVGQYVVVRLEDTAGNTVASTRTTKNGQYTFEGIYPGRYRVAMTPKKKYTFITYGTSITSYVNGTGYTDYFDLSLSEKITGKNAGMIIPAVVKGKVWYDEDHNGRQGDDEGGLLNAQVVLIREDGKLQSMTPAASGKYSFDSVAPGRYRVEIRLPATDRFVQDADLGRFTVSTDGLTATTSWFNVEAEDKLAVPTIGGVSLSPLSGVAFVDANANGLRDAGEQPLPGLTVTVSERLTGNVVRLATTAADGSFSAEALYAGDYTVSISVPGGYMLSRTPAVTLPFNSSDVNASYDVHVGMDTDWSNQQLGVVRPCTLEGTVWMDENSNGMRDVTENGPADRCFDVIDLSTGEKYVTLVSGEDGVFAKYDMLPGSYRVVYHFDGFDTAVFGDQTNFVPYGQNALAYDGVTLQDGSAVTGLLLGLHSYTSVGGMAWKDQNGTIEPIEGVTVRLMDGTGTVLSTCVTGEDGRYQFDWLTAGSYSLDASVPEDQTMVHPGDWRMVTGWTNSAMDYTNGSYGRSNLFEVRMGRHLLKQDIGAVGNGNLGDMCWLDLNGNGLQESGEEGIPGVTIQLVDDGRVIAETVTDQYGYYVFKNLYPGEYVLHVVYPSEIVPTSWRSDIAGVTSVMQETGIDSYPVRVTSNGRNYNADIGFRLVENGVYPAGYGNGAIQNWKEKK